MHCSSSLSSSKPRIQGIEQETFNSVHSIVSVTINLRIKPFLHLSYCYCSMWKWTGPPENRPVTCRKQQMLSSAVKTIGFSETTLGQNHEFSSLTSASGSPYSRQHLSRVSSLLLQRQEPQRRALTNSVLATVPCSCSFPMKQQV